MADSAFQKDNPPATEGPPREISCPNCGRTYPPSLFEYGRTIHCACGARVGAEPLSRAVNVEGGGSPDLRFFADVMLGRLARWLRILGFDTAYEESIDDADLVRRAVDEGRVILTRDRLMPEQWRVEGIHLMEVEEPMAQVREVSDAFGLAGHIRLFTRCSQCNTMLSEVSKEQAAGHVPDDVLQRVDAFKHCPGCGRFYWEGSHVKRMRRMIDRALGMGE